MPDRPNASEQQDSPLEPQEQRRARLAEWEANLEPAQRAKLSEERRKALRAERRRRPKRSAIRPAEETQAQIPAYLAALDKNAIAQSSASPSDINLAYQLEWIGNHLLSLSQSLKAGRGDSPVLSDECTPTPMSLHEYLDGVYRDFEQGRTRRAIRAFSKASYVGQLKADLQYIYGHFKMMNNRAIPLLQHMDNGNGSTVSNLHTQIAHCFDRVFGSVALAMPAGLDRIARANLLLVLGKNMSPHEAAEIPTRRLTRQRYGAITRDFYRQGADLLLGPRSPVPVSDAVVQAVGQEEMSLWREMGLPATKWPD